MKRITALTLVVSFLLVMTSCKKDDAAGIPETIDLEKTALNKITPILKEATELFNTGNKIIASTKAEQARDILNTAFTPGRKLRISPKCPLKHIISDDAMIIMALSCDDVMHKQPALVKGAFQEHIMMFTITFNAEGAKGVVGITSEAMANKVKNTPAGTTFTGLLEITDPGILMAADDALSSYSMNYNAKILEIAQTSK